MSGANIDLLMGIWDKFIEDSNKTPPFQDHQDLYSTIDSGSLGNIPWEHFKAMYTGDLSAARPIPDWIMTPHEVWYQNPRKVIHDLLANTDFNGEFDYVPYQEYSHVDNKGHWNDFMSGNWAWKQAVRCVIPFFLSFLINIFQ
jgi:hypothetical protein